MTIKCQFITKGPHRKFPPGSRSASILGMGSGLEAMCDVLLDELSCVTDGGMDGLVHFCQHVKSEQEREAADRRCDTTGGPGGVDGVRISHARSCYLLGPGPWPEFSFRRGGNAPKESAPSRALAYHEELHNHDLVSRDAETPFPGTPFMHTYINA